MSTLFDDWLLKAEADQKAAKAAARKARPKGQKCSTCEHHRGHQWSPKYHYCALGRSTRTPNGLMKTTPGNWCDRWEAVKP